MSALRIEHVNVTVSDPDRVATLLQALFDWRVRWRGPAMAGGHTIHVGDDACYVAVYAPPNTRRQKSFAKGQPLNHIGVEVDDLDATETKVLAAGLETFSHGDYHPRRRFYFMDP